jgi:hypothetical protein
MVLVMMADPARRAIPWAIEGEGLAVMSEKSKLERPPRQIDQGEVWGRVGPDFSAAQCGRGTSELSSEAVL